jgi:hypothetical protein
MTRHILCLKKFDCVAKVSPPGDGVVTEKSDDWTVFVWDLSGEKKRFGNYEKAITQGLHS